MNHIYAELQPGRTVGSYIEQAHTWDAYDLLEWQDSISGRHYYPHSVIDTVVHLHLVNK
ncbi:MAG: hypothetical protein IJ785_04950 [Bacteroidales bacterium]|nr:hypothetical protein [Bacteroidales bacterium]